MKKKTIRHISQPDTAPPKSRSDRKHQSILDAATTAFLQSGYQGTSMDEIAARAAVSKQTVYKHFAGKEQLFRTIITDTTSKVDQRVDDLLHSLSLSTSSSIDKDLHEFARRLLIILMQPRVLALRRLVIAEAGRFPKLGRTYYEQGPHRLQLLIASTLEQLTQRGQLQAQDPRLAADHFYWLVMSIPLNQVMVCGDDVRFSPTELKRFADSGVRVFLAAYKQ